MLQDFMHTSVDIQYHVVLFYSLLWYGYHCQNYCCHAKQWTTCDSEKNKSCVSPFTF